MTLPDLNCGVCGVALVSGGEMQVAFAVPPPGSDSHPMCESCARAVGVWEDEEDDE